MFSTLITQILRTVRSPVDYRLARILLAVQQPERIALQPALAVGTHTVNMVAIVGLQANRCTQACTESLLCC